MRTRFTSLLIAFLTAAGLVTVAPAAASAPTIRSVVRFPLPAGQYSVASGLGAVWAVRTDEAGPSVIVFRINPRTNRIFRVRELPFPGGNIAIGYDSLWISDYFGNAVWRLSRQGVVRARIDVGLQPQDIHVAFGSVWVANHHGHSITRIDPRTNRRIATESAGDPHAFRNGPQAMTHDAHRLYVGSSNLDVLQSINPRTNVTSTPPGPTDDVFCGNLIAVAGHVWSVDHCTNTLYQLTLGGTIVRRITYGPTTGTDVPAVQESLLLHDRLWVSVDQHYDQDTGIPIGGGRLEARDPATGALLDQVSVGGDVSQMAAGFGSFWLFDGNEHVLRRVTLAQTA